MSVLQTDPLRAHRWVIREIAGMGVEDLADRHALLYAKSVDLPKRVEGSWTKATIEWYVVPENVEFLHLLSTLGSGSVRIDATSPQSVAEPGEKVEVTPESMAELDDKKTVATWWLDSCRFDHFEWDKLDYASNEILLARLVVKPVEVRVTVNRGDIPPVDSESNVSNEGGG